MITSNVYADKLKELEKLNYTDRPIIPANEPVFNVFLNTRRIVVPDAFETLAVEGEHLAETIWFTVDRYFDGQDLAQPEKTWGVQFVNALGEESLHPITYKYLGNQGLDDDQNSDVSNPPSVSNTEATLKLGWDIHYDLTKQAGNVTIALKCFQIKEGSLIYNLETEPVTLRIKKGLNVEHVNDNTYPSETLLEDLVNKISKAYENNAITTLDYNKINPDTLPRIDGIQIKGQQLTSADFKNISYAQINNKPKINIDGTEYEITADEPVNIQIPKIEIDAELKDSTNPVQNGAINNKIKTIDAEIQKLWTEVGDMTYIPLKINQFTNNINYAEKNHNLTGPIVFNWEVEGNVASQEIKYVEGGTVLSIEDIEARTFSHNFGTFTNDATFTLTVRDKKDNPTMANTQIIFTYKVFYGAASAPDGDYTSDFITNLEGSSLQETKETTFTIDRAENEYIYFALPQSYGTPIFSVGGFEGGFGNAPVKTITYNETNYDIWRSDNMITATNREIKVV